MNNESYILADKFPVLFWYQLLQEKRRTRSLYHTLIGVFITYKDYMQLELENNPIYLN